MFGTYYYSGRNIQETIEIAVGLQPWVFDRLSHVNPPAWSIGVEAFFYLIFPFTIMAFTKSRIKISGLFTILLWVLTMIFSAKAVIANGVTPSPEAMYFNLYNPLMHLNEFFFGVLAGSFLTIKRDRPLRLLHPAVPFSLLCGLLIARSMSGFPNINGLHFANGALAPLFVWLIASIANSKQSTLAILNRRPFVLLGEASYAMYVLHYPLRLWFYTSIPEELKKSPLTELLMYCALLIALSILVHIAFENPLRILIRKWLSTERKNEIKLNESAGTN
jgi:peptidoglycan/LPS O-acetylase OafA/YrhL